MRACQNAYTILELVVYLSLSLILLVVLGRITIQVDRFIRRSSNRLNKNIERTLFFDCMKRDLMCAFCERAFWDLDKLVCRKSTCDVGYRVRDDRVLRVEGRYDFSKRVWLKQSSGLMAYGIGDITWKLTQKNNIVTGVRVMCGKKRFFVRLRNGTTLRSCS